MSTAGSPGKPFGHGGKPPLALIAGPTASGKSDLAVRLAKALVARGQPAEIVNADSAQVYADLQVLSARPSEEEMAGIPHHLFGAWDGAISCSAADWANAARAAIAQLHEAGTVPVLVGGTGLYMRTLLNGIAPIPAIDPQVREQVRALPQPEARAALETEDPEAATKLAPADTTRTARALEVVRSTGLPIAHWQAQTTGGIGGGIALHPVVMLPDREWLYERCDQRFAMMLEQGAVEEVEALLAGNLDPALPVMRAIGVREIAAWLQGKLSRDEMIAAGQLATRQYAKRQYTWFRNQSPDDWQHVESKNCDIDIYFESLLRF
ncbi:tRNA (adenosine(37)-N6)-dimethylallyltransferase MiaA [Parerythrobacter lacustris]|uniref:tRNA dimethylallyltransferase n=1 Tax=Parerythrobacter lacustris TaxID=2969984 RepID=A0ABT1XQN7_9SPHN|nr:tRNA (adenosine(37)-N6)-dimethylallyltransferase MiaA [Parerythrobacter lacustris]MCR2833974.1 tRNA (adenosine(37)-N6)-dimethylallyltransferase MiaA [Parerythrobacter lacustris]